MHVLNECDGLKPIVRRTNELIDFIRQATTDIQLSGKIIGRKNWRDAYIMGDFNCDDIKNIWN